MNGYEPELNEEGWCRDCGAFCWQPTPTPAPCEVDGCECPRCERARRAAELDDRPAPALQNLARDIEAEARPDLDALMVERFGPKPRPA